MSCPSFTSTWVPKTLNGVVRGSFLVRQQAQLEASAGGKPLDGSWGGGGSGGGDRVVERIVEVTCSSELYRYRTPALAPHARFWLLHGASLPAHC